MPVPHPSPADPPLSRDDLALDRMFAEERFHACPPELLARIAAAHVARPLGLGRRLLALVSGAALAAGAAVALTGRAPALEVPGVAFAGPPRALDVADATALAPDLPTLPVGLLLGLASILLAAGVALARRWGHSPAEQGAAPEEAA